MADGGIESVRITRKHSCTELRLPVQKGNDTHIMNITAGQIRFKYLNMDYY
jgi:hypothetical protein